jgi:hypothetical protein
MKITAIHPSQFARRTGFSKLEKHFLLQKNRINTPESTLFNSSTPQYYTNVRTSEQAGIQGYTI